MITEYSFDVKCEHNEYVIKAHSYKISQKGIWNPSEPILEFYDYEGRLIASVVGWKSVKKVGS